MKFFQCSWPPVVPNWARMDILSSKLSVCLPLEVRQQSQPLRSLYLTLACLRPHAVQGRSSSSFANHFLPLGLCCSGFKVFRYFHSFDRKNIASLAASKFSDVFLSFPSKMFFVHLATYRKLYNEREDAITDLGFESRVASNQSGNFVAVEIKNDASILLATFCWWINFMPDLNSFTETYNAVLTVEGLGLSL